MNLHRIHSQAPLKTALVAAVSTARYLNRRVAVSYVVSRKIPAAKASCGEMT